MSQPHLCRDGISQPHLYRDRISYRIQSEFAFSDLDLEDDQSPNRDHVPHQRQNWTEVQTFPSTAQFFDYHLRQAMKREKFGEYPDEVGKGILLHLIHKAIPASRRTFLAVNLPETFSLSHNDLDLQNILCDDYGNVTGIVDWEGCTARPHHLGWAATPKWLRSEWEADYNWPFDKSSLSPVQIQQYRQEYTTALDTEAPETWQPGASYPSMSYLTCSLYEACTFGNLDSWCNRFLHVILPCLDSREFFIQLGKAKAWAPITQGPIQGENLNSWLEKGVLEWYFQYGRSSE
ncbi:hypothetical protein E2P81_ATG01425 [Venturia nashicola]|nr:hypothetical protein E2P81_ATG01425 [Venturia nashicola]